MSKPSKKSTKRFMNMSKRGASMVEYALLLVCVLIAGAVGFKQLKTKVAPAGENSANELTQ